MIKTGNGHRRQVQRTYNKSVHWNTQDSSKIFLDDSHPYKSHNKKKSIGVSLEFTNLDNLNPMLTQTNNDCKSADDFFENKEFTGPKLNGLSVTPDVIVQWIRDTLEDATYFKIPGNVVNPDKKDILKRYGIDRESLSVDGISEASISRLYRCLFIYSIGFNELIQSLLSHSKNKISCASSIWKVFTILLEYCCKADYKALINELKERHNHELREVNRDYDSRINELNNTIATYKETLSNIQKYAEQCQKEKREEEDVRKRVEKESKDKAEQYEYEVKLRLQFESKLNGMHSVNRMVESQLSSAKVERDKAVDELSNFQEQISYFKNQNDKSTEIIEELRAQLLICQEKYANISKENEYLKEHIFDHERKIESGAFNMRSKDDFNSNTGKYFSVEKALSELRSLARIGEDPESNALNVVKHSDFLPIEQIEVYEDRFNKLNEKYNKVVAELHESKLESIGEEVIIKEREDRIKKIYNELNQLKEKHQALESKYAALLIDRDSLKEECDTK